MRQQALILVWLMVAVNANITLTVQSVQPSPGLLTDTVRISWLSSDASDGRDDDSFYIGITNLNDISLTTSFSSEQTPDDSSKDVPQIAQIEVPSVSLPGNYLASAYYDQHIQDLIPSTQVSFTLVSGGPGEPPILETNSVDSPVSSTTVPNNTQSGIELSTNTVSAVTPPVSSPTSLSNGGGGMSATLIGVSMNSTSSTQSTSQDDQTAPTSSSTPSASADISDSKTPIIVGSVIGSIILLAIVLLIILIVIRRYKTRRETIQFFEQKMVRSREPLSSSAESTAHPMWEPLNLEGRTNTAAYGNGIESLPAYGYSNYDFIEKSDHQRPSSPPLPSGAMSPYDLPKIVTTPPTPPQSMLATTTSSPFNTTSVKSRLATIPERSETGSSFSSQSSATLTAPSSQTSLQNLNVELQELRKQMIESRSMDYGRRKEITKQITEKLKAMDSLLQAQQKK